MVHTYSISTFRLQNELKDNEEWLRFFSEEELNKQIDEGSDEGKFIISLVQKNNELKLKPDAFVAIIKNEELHKHHNLSASDLKNKIEAAATPEEMFKFIAPTLPAKNEDALKKRFEQSGLDPQNYQIQKKDKTFEVTSGHEDSAPTFVISHEGVKCQKNNFNQEDAKKMIAVYKANTSEPHYVGSISASSTEQYKLMLDAAIEAGANLSQLALPKGATEHSQQEMRNYLTQMQTKYPNSFSRPTSTILFESLQEQQLHNDQSLSMEN